MNKFKILLLLIIFSITLLSFNNVLAVGRETQYGLNATANVGDLPTAFSPFSGLASENILDRIGAIIGAILSFVGIVFLALMIYGGILWMTAAGNEQTVAKAQKVITWSSIGLVTLFASFAIVQFIGRETVRPIVDENVDQNIEIEDWSIDDLDNDNEIDFQFMIDESVQDCVELSPANNPYSLESCQCKLDPNFGDEEYCSQVEVLWTLWNINGF